MPTSQQKQTYARREFLEAVAKRSAVLAGLVAAAHLPYKKPAVQSFFGVRSAYAQATPTTELTASGQLGDEDVGTLENTGQDAYEFYCPAGITITIDVTVVQLWAEIGLFAPGVPTSGTNLLIGAPGGLASSGVGQPINTSYAITTAGTYTIAIEDERDDPAETSGTYVITITAPVPIGPITQVITDGPETLIHDSGT